MAKLLKLRRGSTTQHSSFTGAEGEVTIDTTKDTAVVHDGSQVGGRPLLREDMSNLPAGTIDNADINASAAIAGTKVSPDFGSQDITTTGKIKFANVYTNESDLPSASTYHGMFAHVHSTGLAYYSHGGNWIKLAKLDAPDFTGGIDVTGNITATGTLGSGDITISDNSPKLTFNDGDQDPDYEILVDGGSLAIRSGGSNRIRVKSDNNVDISGNLDVGAGVDVTGNITAGDNDHLYLGDGADINIYHDGTDSYFYTGAGTAFFRTAANKKLASFIADGAAELYHADNKRLETTSYGAAVSGILASTGDIKITNDTGKFVSGASDDLQIYHDGNHSRIDDVGTGSLLIQTNGTDVQINKGTSEIMAKFIADGAVELYNGMGGNAAQKKFETTATGVSVTGALVASGDVTAFSDQTLKKDITTINDALGLCGKLRGVSYKWIKDDKPSIGVIAQEIEQHIPEIVSTTQLDGKDVKSVDYGKIVGVLINAVNELKAELDEYKATFETIKIQDLGELDGDEAIKKVLVLKKES